MYRHIEPIQFEYCYSCKSVQEVVYGEQCAVCYSYIVFK